MAKARQDMLNEFLNTEAVRAAETGDVAYIATCLGKGAPVDSMNPRKETLLVVAYIHNHENVMQFLLANGADPVHLANYKLKCATLADDITGIDAALAEGAEIDFKAEYRSTVLHLAIDKNAFDAARHLMARGADIELPNNSEETPLVQLIAKGGKAPAYMAVVMDLLKRGADVNKPMHDHNKPHLLTKLFIWDYQELGRALLAHGADIFMPDKDGNTLVDLVMKENSSDKKNKQTLWLKMMMEHLPGAPAPVAAAPEPVDPRVKEDTESAPIPDLKKKPFTPGQPPAGGA